MILTTIVAQLGAIHAKRVTVQDKDMRLVDRLRGMMGGKTYIAQ